MRVYDRKQVVWDSVGFKSNLSLTHRRLNLGCGSDVREGWVNLDLHAPTADVRHDLFSFPLPFHDDSFNAVLLDNVLEHVPHQLCDPKSGKMRDGAILLLEEVHRVLAPEGQVYISVPYGNTDNDLWNIVHYRSFIPNTLGFLWGKTGLEPTAWETSARFHLVKLRVRRYVGGRLFNNQYHVPKYLGKTMDWVGKKWEIVWVLQKPVPGDRIYLWPSQDKSVGKIKQPVDPERLVSIVEPLYA